MIKDFHPSDIACRQIIKDRVLRYAFAGDKWKKLKKSWKVFEPIDAIELEISYRLKVAISNQWRDN